jgi:hypothetical protein
MNSLQVKASDVKPSKLPPPGYDDQQVVSVAMRQMLSGINSSGVRNAASAPNNSVDATKPAIIIHKALNTTEAAMELNVNGSTNITNDSADNSTTLDYHEAPVFHCKEPWSRVKPGVFPAFWRVIYWTSQVLTWQAFKLLLRHLLTCMY